MVPQLDTFIYVFTPKPYHYCPAVAFTYMWRISKIMNVHVH